MFTIKAGYSNEIEVKTGIERVREFFSNAANFVDLMPGVRQIHVDGKGIAHWQVEVDLPVVGKISQRFALEIGESTDDRVEWVPFGTEAENLLRYSADFLAKAKDATLVHFTQLVELRRKSARDLHAMAAFAGESLISREMTKRITAMISTFIERAKQRLEQ